MWMCGYILHLGQGLYNIELIRSTRHHHPLSKWSQNSWKLKVRVNTQKYFFCVVRNKRKQVLEYQVIWAWRESLGNIEVRGLPQPNQITSEKNVSKGSGEIEKKIVWKETREGTELFSVAVEGQAWSSSCRWKGWNRTLISSQPLQLKFLGGSLARGYSCVLLNVCSHSYKTWIFVHFPFCVGSVETTLVWSQTAPGFLAPFPIARSFRRWQRVLQSQMFVFQILSLWRTPSLEGERGAY